MKNCIIFLALSFTLFSCTNNRTQFDLTLTETGTSSPISDARILISGDRFTGNIDFPIIRSVIDTIFTDQNGFAEFSHTEDFDVIDFSISKDQYFSLSLTDENDQIELGEKKSYQFEMSGFAYLKFLLVDSDTIDEYGIRFNPRWLGSSATDYSVGDYELNGIIPANKEHKYTYKIGDQPLQEGFVTIGKNDSTTVLLEY